MDFILVKSDVNASCSADTDVDKLKVMHRGDDLQLMNVAATTCHSQAPKSS